LHFLSGSSFAARYVLEGKVSDTEIYRLSCIIITVNGERTSSCSSNGERTSSLYNWDNDVIVIDDSS